MVEIRHAANDAQVQNATHAKAAGCRLRQPQLAVLRHHNLPALSGNPIEHAQSFVYLWIGIAAHTAIIHHHEELRSVLIAAQGIRHIDEMPGAAIEGAHDVKFVIMPFVSVVGIENQIHMGIFGKAELLDVAVPVPDADEQLFDVISRWIYAQIPIVDIELQDAVAHERPHLWSYIYTAIAGTILRCHQRPALRCRRTCKKKHAGHSKDHTLRRTSAS